MKGETDVRKCPSEKDVRPYIPIVILYGSLTLTRSFARGNDHR